MVDMPMINKYFQKIYGISEAALISAMLVATAFILTSLTITLFNI